MSQFLRPRKRFGQHFLEDVAVIDAIIQLIAPNPNQHCVEIGPGRGALTIPLLQRVKSLDVVELDRDLIAPLQRQCQSFGELKLHVADALTFDFASLVKDKPLRLIGNLPYNISTPLIFHLLTFADHIQDMHFMLQKEVADRLAAKPGTADYGRLSVMVQYHCSVTGLLDVGPESFNPPPKVNSSVIRLVPQKKLFLVNSYEHFVMLVKTAFSQRRKTLRNNLKKIINVEKDFGINLQLRPEQISVAEFVTLSNEIIKNQ